MKHRVLKKTAEQPHVSRMRLKNPLGLRAAFYEMETEELVCLFTPRITIRVIRGACTGALPPPCSMKPSVVQS